MAKAVKANPRLVEFVDSELHNELNELCYETFREDKGGTYFPDLKKKLFAYIEENRDYYTDDFIGMAYIWVGDL